MVFDIPCQHVFVQEAGEKERFSWAFHCSL